jgi:hypothetical protein
VLNKTNFTHEYAATEIEPTDKEKEYVFNNLEQIDFENPIHVIKHYNCYIGCPCSKDDELSEDVDVFMYLIDIPFVVENFEEERTLNVLYCTKCHSWSLCD